MPKFLFNLIVFLSAPLVISGADLGNAPRGVMLADLLFDYHFSYDEMKEYLTESPYFTIIEARKGDPYDYIYFNYLTDSTEKRSGQDWLLRGWEKVLNLNQSFPNRFYTRLYYKDEALESINITFIDNWWNQKNYANNVIEMLTIQCGAPIRSERTNKRIDYLWEDSRLYTKVFAIIRNGDDFSEGWVEVSFWWKK